MLDQLHVYDVDIDNIVHILTIATRYPHTLIKYRTLHNTENVNISIQINTIIYIKYQHAKWLTLD